MNTVSEEKKQVIMNLYLSGIGEEFIAMQLDLEIPTVISILKALDVYGKTEAELTSPKSSKCVSQLEVREKIENY